MKLSWLSSTDLDDSWRCPWFSVLHCSFSEVIHLQNYTFWAHHFLCVSRCHSFYEFRVIGPLHRCLSILLEMVGYYYPRSSFELKNLQGNYQGSTIIFYSGWRNRINKVEARGCENPFSKLWSNIKPFLNVYLSHYANGSMVKVNRQCILLHSL